MDKLFWHFARMSGRFNNWFGQRRQGFCADDSLHIFPYRGFANACRLFIRGRILEDEVILEDENNSRIATIINNVKRFDSDELPHADVLVELHGQTFQTRTDREGYFVLDTPWVAPMKGAENRWLTATISLLDEEKKTTNIMAEGEIYFPSAEADYGVITDVDDTVLQSHVTSLLRLKMLYATFLQAAHQRLPMEGIVDLFQAFVRGGDGKRENPIFYVSNSPWNIYDLLERFMAIRKLPKGPILLRDYGLRPAHDFAKHKLEAITNILEMYPQLPFVMLGDTASKDADFYLELAQRFPNRIKAIYIRKTKDTKNARRVAKLIEDHSHIDAVLVNSSAEIEAHARGRGLFS